MTIKECKKCKVKYNLDSVDECPQCKFEKKFTNMKFKRNNTKTSKYDR